MILLSYGELGGGTYAIPAIKIVTLFSVSKEFPGPREDGQFASASGC